MVTNHKGQLDITSVVLSGVAVAVECTSIIVDNRHRDDRHTADNRLVFDCYSIPNQASLSHNVFLSHAAELAKVLVVNAQKSIYIHHPSKIL